MGVKDPPVRGVTWCSQFGHLQQARGLSKRRNWPHRNESHDSVASAGTFQPSHVKREERINTQVYPHSTTSDGRWCHKFPLALICGARIQETHLSVLGCGEGAPSWLKTNLVHHTKHAQCIKPRPHKPASLLSLEHLAQFFETYVPSHQAFNAVCARRRSTFIKSPNHSKRWPYLNKDVLLHKLVQ